MHFHLTLAGSRCIVSLLEFLIVFDLFEGTEKF
jgi:hypothetical protein